MKLQYNANLDYFKVLLSTLIVAIHCPSISKALYPWARLAVPLFFLLTSYFFFSNVKTIKDKRSKINFLKKYIARQLKLYGFWFLTLLPITIIIRIEWFRHGFINGIIIMVKRFFFGSTFFASWFIMACIIGVTIIFYLTSHVNMGYVIFGGLGFFIWTTVDSTYRSFLNSESELYTIITWYTTHLAGSYTSFPVSLLWIAFGKVFADHRVVNKHIVTVVVITLLSCILLWFECKFVYLRTGRYDFDCFFFLLPAVLGIFYMALSLRPSSSNWLTDFFRKNSTITYCLHGSMIPVVKVVLLVLDVKSSLLCFVITIALCHSATIVLIWLSQFPKMKFLRNAY